MGSDDAEEVPVVKIIRHFRDVMLESGNTYVIDGLPFEKKDLEEWIRVVGTPNVINLTVDENETIKRTRKKNESDLTA